jgi:CheY-like chemotaxis protein
MQKEYDIIIVDDDEDIRLMLETMLNFSKLKAVSCHNPPEMFRLMEVHHQPRLIVMDMLLSGFDGRDICRQLKANAATVHIPVLMISAHPQAAQACKEAGADGFIEKPFEMETMISTIRRMMADTAKTP